MPSTGRMPKSSRGSVCLSFQFCQRFEKACGESSIDPSALGKRLELLGEGHYGKVYRRHLRLDDGKTIDAACKEIQPKHIKNCADLLDEAKLMTQLK